jgi:excisionase family DNA binding protein
VQDKITPNKYLSQSQLGEILGVTGRTIRNLAAKGLIPSIRLTGKLVRYERSAVEKALQKLTVGAI